MTAAALADRLGARRVGTEFAAACPLHDDQHASLNFRDRDGRIVVTCRAGCAQGDVWAALRSAHPDLLGRERDQWRPSAAPARVTRYAIRDAAGELQAVHVREDRADGKRLWWETPTGARGLGGRAAASLPLYRSETVAARPDDLVIVTEGERAADAAVEHGLLAVATVTGANGCPDLAALGVLRGRRVVLWPDADDPGRLHMRRVARALDGIAESVAVVTVPSTAPKGWDCADLTLDDEGAVAAYTLATLARPWDAAQCDAHDSDSCAECAGSQDDRQDEQSAHEQAVIFETASDFLRRLDAEVEPEWLVRDLVPAEGIALFHGRPRSFKSLAALDVALALASGLPAFNVERFSVPRPVNVAYLTEEDAARIVAFRLRLMLAGRGLKVAPERLMLRSRAGWNLELLDDQRAMLRAIHEAPHPPEVIALDPARASFPSVDGGPKDGAPALAFMRRVMRETSVRLFLVCAHDVKPSRDMTDGRSRAEKAAGGVLFSAAETPVGFTRLTDRETFAEPCSFKVGADPAPFRVRLESETPSGEGFRGFLRLVAETTTARELGSAETDRAILALLADADSWMNTAAIREAIGKRSGDVTAALGRLTAAGKVTSRDAARGAKEYRRGLAE